MQQFWQNITSDLNSRWKYIYLASLSLIYNPSFHNCRFFFIFCLKQRYLKFRAKPNRMKKAIVSRSWGKSNYFFAQKVKTAISNFEFCRRCFEAYHLEQVKEQNVFEFSLFISLIDRWLFNGCFAKHDYLCNSFSKTLSLWVILKAEKIFMKPPFHQSAIHLSIIADFSLLSAL